MLADHRTVPCAGRHAEKAIDAGRDTGAISFDFVESPRRDQTFKNPFVDKLRIDAPGKVGEIAERRVSPRFEEMLDRLPDIRLVGPQQKRPERTGNFVLGLESLPVEW